MAIQLNSVKTNVFSKALVILLTFTPMMPHMDDATHGLLITCIYCIMVDTRGEIYPKIRTSLHLEHISATVQKWTNNDNKNIVSKKKKSN